MQQNKNEHEVQRTLFSRSYIALIIIQQQIHQWQQTNAQLTVDPSQTRNFSATLSESKTSNFPGAMEATGTESISPNTAVFSFRIF